MTRCISFCAADRRLRHQPAKAHRRLGGDLVRSASGAGRGDIVDLSQVSMDDNAHDHPHVLGDIRADPTTLHPLGSPQLVALSQLQVDGC